MALTSSSGSSGPICGISLVTVVTATLCFVTLLAERALPTVKQDSEECTSGALHRKVSSPDDER
jgi:hypothetical protein